MLEGIGEYHSSSAALGLQHSEVTKQPLVPDWLATPEAADDVKPLSLEGDSCRGE